MSKMHWLPAFFLFVSLLDVSAQAAEPAGMIKTSQGPVSIERADKKLLAVVGTPLQQGDKVRTGSNGAVGFTLRDNTLLSAGPNSLIVIDRFAFDSTTLAGDMSIGIRQGTLSVVTGKMAKNKPDTVEFRTPTSVLGVRGTEFVVEVGGGRDE
ncbi:FecR domain-containing protein [Dechloromonas denitrificans]|uniref:FecR family protein n=1 Tax=Dechloromonas denitrificans TaxID=281362 RepID=UPI001CF81E38|nr:FecR domain-containing protein [Dechloromonas denitrificans]